MEQSGFGKGELGRTVQAGRSSREETLPRGWFVAALILRMMMTVGLHWYSIEQGLGGFQPTGSGGDDQFYWKASLELLAGSTVHSPNVYPVVLSWLFRLTGPSLIAGQLLSAVVGAISVLLGVKISAALSSDKSPDRRIAAMHWTGFLLTFYPSALFYSTQLVRDSLIVALGLGAIYFGLLFSQKARFGYLAGFVCIVVVLYTFRPYAAVCIAAGLMTVVALARNRWIVPLILSLAVVPLALGGGLFGIDLWGKMLDLEWLMTFRERAYSTGRSSIGISIDFSNPISFVSTFGYSFLTALMGPLPWQIRDVTDLIALPEAIVLWILLPVWFRLTKVVFSSHNRSMRLPIFVSLYLLAAVALYSDNIGANLRLRLLPIMSLVTCAAVFLPKVKW